MTRSLPSVVAIAGLAGALMQAAPHEQGRASGSDCVTIGRPKPDLVYTYRHVESTGNSTQTTQQWESVTETGSRVKITGPAGNMSQVNEHRIVDDVAVLYRTTKLDAFGQPAESTSFSPGLISDPAFRACASRTWTIASVAATFRSSRIKATSATPAGTLRIVALRERVTVAAGSFETVRYVRTSQSTDEYWKSLEHGVIVKHTATVNGQLVTETLVQIK
jgi:hypothetical protein